MVTIFSEDNITGKNSIAFFDLDRTLTKAISGNEMARLAYKKGLITGTDLMKAFYLSVLYKLNLRDPQKIIDEMVSWADGISEKTMDELCTEVFRMVLYPSVYEQARGEIKVYKEKNIKVVILSSALTQICREISINLGMDDFICSDLEVVNGYLTGRPVGHLCFGEEKAIRLLKYCEKNNTNPSDTWYYGDSFSDMSVLSIVGKPVCVNPDNKLKREALKRGWRILYWN